MNKQILIKSCLALAIASLAACSGEDGQNGKDGKDGKDAPVNNLSPSQLLTNVNNAWYIDGQNTVKMAKEHSMKINAEKGAAKTLSYLWVMAWVFLLLPLLVSLKVR